MVRKSIGDTVLVSRRRLCGFIIDAYNNKYPTEYLIDTYALRGYLPDDYDMPEDYRYHVIIPESDNAAFVKNIDLGLRPNELNSCRMVLTEVCHFLDFKTSQM